MCAARAVTFYFRMKGAIRGQERKRDAETGRERERKRNRPARKEEWEKHDLSGGYARNEETWTDVGTNCEGKAWSRKRESEKATQREQQRCAKTKTDCDVSVCARIRGKRMKRKCVRFETRREKAGRNRESKREEKRKGDRERAAVIVWTPVRNSDSDSSCAGRPCWVSLAFREWVYLYLLRTRWKLVYPLAGNSITHVAVCYGCVKRGSVKSHGTVND